MSERGGRPSAPDGKRAAATRRVHRAAVLARNDSGVTGLEYALIACFVALGVLIGTTMAGNGLNQIFFVIGTKIMDASDIAAQH
jgi:Flp pilus assembly pilin Flp